MNDIAATTAITIHRLSESESIGCVDIGLFPSMALKEWRILIKKCHGYKKMFNFSHLEDEMVINVEQAVLLHADEMEGGFGPGPGAFVPQARGVSSSSLGIGVETGLVIGAAGSPAAASPHVDSLGARLNGGFELLLDV